MLRREVNKYWSTIHSCILLRTLPVLVQRYVFNSLVDSGIDYKWGYKLTIGDGGKCREKFCAMWIYTQFHLCVYFVYVFRHGTYLKLKIYKKQRSNQCLYWNEQKKEHLRIASYYNLLYYLQLSFTVREALINHAQLAQKAF
jgi:hypothetical protein